MPRINLHFLQQSPHQVGPHLVYYERVKTVLVVGSSTQRPLDCIIDTGCILSVFGEKHWTHFQNDITWIYTPGNCSHLPDWLSHVTGVGGKPYPCGLGLVSIQIVELPSLVKSPPVEILAKFPLDGGVYSQNLLGLGGGAFSNWRFTLDYANQQAWLEY